MALRIVLILFKNFCEAIKYHRFPQSFFGAKIYFIKCCPNWLNHCHIFTRYLLQKMSKFELNWTTFFKYNFWHKFNRFFCIRPYNLLPIVLIVFLPYWRKCVSKKSVKIPTKILFNKKLSNLVQTLTVFR